MSAELNLGKTHEESKRLVQIWANKYFEVMKAVEKSADWEMLLAWEQLGPFGRAAAREEGNASPYEKENKDD